ncbi:hypothetical protein Tco_0324299 [Tanacetum coccineum]
MAEIGCNWARIGPSKSSQSLSIAHKWAVDSIRRDESEDFDVDKAQEETKKKSKQDSPNTPPGSPPSPPPPPPPPSGASGASGTTGASDSAQAPPPPPPSSSTHQGGQSTSTAAPSSSKTAASAEYSAWTTTDTQIKPSVTTIPDDLYMDDETTADEQAYSSGDEVGRDHIPTVNLRQSWWKPLTEDRPATLEPAWTIPSSDLSMPTNNWASALKSTYVPPQENSLLAQTGDMATFMDWYCKQQGISELTPKDLEGPAFEIVKVFHHDVIHLQFQMEECHKLLTDQVDDAILRYNVSKPLPLGGEPGHVTIQPDFFFNKDLWSNTIWSRREPGRPALTISKMKAPVNLMSGWNNWCLIISGLKRNARMTLRHVWYLTLVGFNTTIYIDLNSSSEGDRRANSPRAVTYQDTYVVSDDQRVYVMKNTIQLCALCQQIDEALWTYRDKGIPDQQCNKSTHDEDGDPSRANIKQALGRGTDKYGGSVGFTHQMTNTLTGYPVMGVVLRIIYLITGRPHGSGAVVSEVSNSLESSINSSSDFHLSILIGASRCSFPKLMNKRDVDGRILSHPINSWSRLDLLISSSFVVIIAHHLLKIMAAPAITISFDSSDESVGSPPSRVILFGDIPTVIPSTSVVAPETSTIALIISSAAPMVETTLVASPTGLCGLVPYSDSDSDSHDERDSPEYITPLPATSPFLYTDSSEAPDFSDGPPSQDPYVAILVGLIAHHRPSSSSSSSDSSPVHSLGLDAPGQTHSGSSTRVVSPRLGYHPRRAPRSSEAYRRWSLVDSVPSFTPVTGSLAPTRADLLPPRKRFRDSYSSEASMGEDTNDDPIETEIYMKLGIGNGDDVRDHVEIDPKDVKDDIEEYEADTSAGDTPAGEGFFFLSGTRDGIVRSFEDMSIDLNDVVRDFYHHMSEVRIDRIVGIVIVQRQLEADQLIAMGQRVSMIERIDSLRLENLKVRAMLDIKRDRVNSLRLYMSLSQEEFR